MRIGGLFGSETCCFSLNNRKLSVELVKVYFVDLTSMPQQIDPWPLLAQTKYEVTLVPELSVELQGILHVVVQSKIHCNII